MKVNEVDQLVSRLRDITIEMTEKIKTLEKKLTEVTAIANKNIVDKFKGKKCCSCKVKLTFETACKRAECDCLFCASCVNKRKAD